MNKIYRIKEGISFENFLELEEYGYVADPITTTIFKLVPQELGTNAPNSLLNNYYCNPEWVEKYYKPNKKELQKQIGLKYDRKGNIKMTEKLKQTLTAWALVIELDEEGWIGFTSADPNDRNTFFNSKILDAYCGNEINFLLLRGLIEEIEVEG